MCTCNELYDLFCHLHLHHHHHHYCSSPPHSGTAELDREAVKKVRAAVLRRMQSVAGMPSDLAGHVLGESSRSPVDWQVAYGMFRGSAFGLAHNLPVSMTSHSCRLNPLV